MARRGVKRDQRIAVKVSRVRPLFYQFNTKDFSRGSSLTDADLQALGHIKLGETGDDDSGALPNGAIVLFRCNAPRPPRVSKTLGAVSGRAPAGGRPSSASTFCAVDKVRDATRAGWRVQDPGLSPGVGSTPKSIITAAKLSNGLLYVFPIARADFTTYGEPLGLIDPTTINTEAERAKLIRACSSPRPGKARKVLDDGSTFTSFYSDDAPLTDMRRISNEILS